MKKLAVVLAVIACLGIGSVQADVIGNEDPCCDFTFVGGWTEIFSLNGEGQPGGWIQAAGTGVCEYENQFQWQLIDAVHQGAEGEYPIYTSVYSGGYFKIWNLPVGTVEFDDVELIVTTNKEDMSFTFEAHANNGAYALKMNGSGHPEYPVVLNNQEGMGGPLGGTGTLCQVPAPGAILLGSMGTGLVAWLRRRNSF